MKYQVGFREIGSVTLGCHGKDLQWLEGVFDTREDAIRAINEDMDAVLKQYQENGDVEEDSTFVDRDAWEIRGNYDDGEDFYCAWQTRDFD